MAGCTARNSVLDLFISAIYESIPEVAIGPFSSCLVKGTDGTYYLKGPGCHSRLPPLSVTYVLLSVAPTRPLGSPYGYGACDRLRILAGFVFPPLFFLILWRQLPSN